MELTEKLYYASRVVKDDYQSLDVVQEFSNIRAFIKFSLTETRWRSVAEAADYLRWAADRYQVDRLISIIDELRAYLIDDLK